MMKNIIPLLFLAASSLVLVGCGEQNSVTLHEPGEYKGAEDNLNVDASALVERLNHQRDR